jgi:D-alanyl-D-alanine carboxypeptidase
MPAASLSLQFTDTGQGIFSQGTFTVRKTGTPQSQSITVDGTWDAIEWLVDGVKRGTGTGSGFTFTVNAADYTAGGHSLSVSVIQGGVPWSKSLNFTVTN